MRKEKMCVRFSDKEKRRSSDRSDGEQEGHAGDSTRRLSEADLRGVGGAEGKRSLGAPTKEAQADQVGRRKGKGKDHARGWRRQEQ